MRQLSEDDVRAVLQQMAVREDGAVAQLSEEMEHGHKIYTLRWPDGHLARAAYPTPFGSMAVEVYLEGHWENGVVSSDLLHATLVALGRRSA